MLADKKKTFLSRSIKKLRLSLLLPAAAAVGERRLPAKNSASNSTKEFVWIDGGGGRGMPAARVEQQSQKLPHYCSAEIADSSGRYEEIGSPLSRQSSSSQCRRRQRQLRTSSFKRSFRFSRRKSSGPTTANNIIQFVSPKLYSSGSINNNNIKSGASPDFKIYDDIAGFYATIGKVKSKPAIETSDKIQQRPLNETHQLQRSKEAHKERSKGSHTKRSQHLQRSSTLSRPSAAVKNPRRVFSTVSIDDVIALPTPPPPLPPRMAAAGPLVRRRLHRAESEANICEQYGRRDKANGVGRSRERLYAFSEETLAL